MSQRSLSQSYSSPAGALSRGGCLLSSSRPHLQAARLSHECEVTPELGRFAMLPLYNRPVPLFSPFYRHYNLARSRIANRPMTSSRPVSVDNRIFYGDWEADLMEGPKASTSALLVLVERKSKYVLIHPVENQKALTVSQAIISSLAKFKSRTITYDNGSEFSNFRAVATATNSKPFFCDPYHTCEKGLVENTIGLIREYFPKKTGRHLPSDLEVYQKVQDEINQRPRKTIGFRPPESFIKQLAS